MCHPEGRVTLAYEVKLTKTSHVYDTNITHNVMKVKKEGYEERQR